MGINGHGSSPVADQGVPLIGQAVELVVADCRFVYKCKNCGKGIIAIQGLGASAKCTDCALVVQLRGFRSHGRQVTTDLGFGFAQEPALTGVETSGPGS